MQPHRSLRRTSRRGVAATEFAVCLPVMVLLLLGVIECCSMIFLKQSLAAAAYEGAHTAVAPDATAAQAISIAEQILSDRRITGGVARVVPGDLQGLPDGEFFEVRVTAPTDANAVMPLNFFGGQTLSASAVFMKEF